MEKNTNNDLLNKSKIKEKLKQSILIIFNQITNGCKRNICYNIFCKNNLFSKLSKIKLFLKI